MKLTLSKSLLGFSAALCLLSNASHAVGYQDLTIPKYAREENAFAGQSLATDGEFTLFGAVEGGEDLTSEGGYDNHNQGYAYLFKNDQLATRLEIPEAFWNKYKMGPSLRKGSFFGSSVAINDSWVAIGAPAVFDHKGAVFVGQKNGDKYNTPLIEISRPSSNPTRFGEAVALNGNYLFIASNSVTFIYEYQGQQWQQIGEIPVSGKLSTDKNAADYGITIVDRYGDDNPLYIYEKAPGANTWTERFNSGTFTDSIVGFTDADITDQAAITLRKSHQYPGMSDVVIFQKSHLTGDWYLEARFSGIFTHYSHESGVAIEGNIAAASVFKKDPTGDSITGQARLIQKINGMWTLHPNILERTPGSGFGHKVDISGGRLTVTAPFYQDDNLVRVGKGYSINFQDALTEQSPALAYNLPSGTTSLTLNWTPRSGSVSSWEVFQSVDSYGNFQRISVLGGSTTSKIYNIAQYANKHLQFKIRGVFSNGTKTAFSDVVKIDRSLSCHHDDIAVPGKLQAEGYLCGGEGVSYHDSDASNNGNAYRYNEGVDVRTNSQGDGLNVGWTQGGEWLKYDIHADAGTYQLKTRVASAQWGSLQVKIDGVNVTGSLGTSTGGWQNWEDKITHNVTLASGAHTVEIYIENGALNIDYIDFILVQPAN